MARKHGSRFGCPHLSPGARTSRRGGVGVCQFGLLRLLYGCRRQSPSVDSAKLDRGAIQKARGRLTGSGLQNSCDDDTMQVICPTCQLLR